MICTHCDAPMPDVSVFCPACGRSTGAPEVGSTNALEKTLSAIAYVGVIPAIVVLFIPALRRKQLLGFHAWQSLFCSLSVLVLIGISRLLFLGLSVLPVVGFLLGWLLVGIGSLGIFILWVVLVVEAARGHRFELPLLGPLSARLATAG
ncbi:MAG TPA: zinc-ribbon domain-containing protein [Terriglobales bacterium]|nr:zinc-ribbon domain-containing protein [Terriglobales bacterium]